MPGTCSGARRCPGMMKEMELATMAACSPEMVSLPAERSEKTPVRNEALSTERSDETTLLSTGRRAVTLTLGVRHLLRSSLSVVR